MRQLVRAAAVAGVFAAGGLSGWLAKPEVPVRHLVATMDVAPPEAVIVLVPVAYPADNPAYAVGLTLPPSADSLEQSAELADDPALAAEWYRKAGDVYLGRLEDYANAARCYRLSVGRLGDGGLSPAAGDSWLLISVKNTLWMEKQHVANVGN